MKKRIYRLTHRVAADEHLAKVGGPPEVLLALAVILLSFLGYAILSR